MKRTFCLLFGLILIAVCSHAQHFKYQAALGPAPATAYYKIPLRPEIAGKLQPGFADIRLYDWKNREVPYFVQQEQPLQTQRLFREYEVVSKEIRNRVNTTLVLRNPSRSPINNLSLLIKNTNVRKRARLSGSADAENWYAIEDNYVLQSVNSSSATSEVKVLDFPLSDYEFYRLVIDDSASAPLNILAAGYYDFTAENGQFTQVPPSLYTLTDSTAARQTILHFTAVSPVILDKLEFEIDSPAFFLRNASILVKETYAGRRGKTETSWVPVHQFQLRSDARNTVPLSGFRTREFLLVIENEDNPPLSIRAIQAFQLNTNLVAELREGKLYQVRFGDEKANKPSYDLAYFSEKLPKELPLLEPKAVTRSEAAANQAEAAGSPKTLFTNKNVIWVAIVVVIALLGFMTYRMLEETSRGKG